MDAIKNIIRIFRTKSIYIFGSIKKFLSSLWDRILDLSTPILAWLVTYLLRSSWASTNSKKIAKSFQSNKQNSPKCFSEHWHEWMLPQNWHISLILSSAVVFLPQILIVFLVFLRILGSNIKWAIEESFIANSWQILASVLGISFVIIVFLTQYAHDRDYERRAFPLFASSTMMVFTVLLGMLTILSFSINLGLMQINKNAIYIEYISLYNLVLFVLNILLVIRLYIKTYLFLQPHYFQNAIQKYSLLQIKRGVYEELIRRIENRLIQNYCEQRNIDYSFIDEHREKIAVKLKSDERIREIVDINLTLLDLAKKRALKYTDKESKGITFVGHLQRRISIEHPEIAFIKQQLNHTQITGLLQRAFKLSEVQIPRLKQDITDDVLLNRDLLSDAIQSGRSAIVESLLDQYVQAIKGFLDVTNDFGIHFSPEIASKEDSWFQSWPIIDEIRHQYISLLDTAIKSGSIEIIQHFVGFLFYVMSQALQKRDHFIFRRFALLFPVIYHKVWNYYDDKSQRDSVFDHCGRLLYDIQHYRINQLLENPNIPNSDLASIAHYSKIILSVLNDLLKQTIDVKDLKFFNKYYGIAKSIPKTELLNELSDEIEIIQIQIDGLSDQENKAETQANLERKQLLS